MFGYIHSKKKKNELISEPIFYPVYCPGNTKLGVTDDITHSPHANAQLVKMLYFHSRPRLCKKGKIYVRNKYV